MGMTVSCFRWLVIDHLHHWGGILPPIWEVNPLEERLQALNWAVEHHYRFYQFYANTLIAVVWSYSISRWFAVSPLLGLRTDFGVIVLCTTLFLGSRDSLSKYYSRMRHLVGRRADNL
jgi:hypothetical protein